MDLGPYRVVAPWIAGFEAPLRQMLADAKDAYFSHARDVHADEVNAKGAALKDARARVASDADPLAADLVAARRQASFQRWRQGPADWRRWAQEVRRLESELALDAAGKRLLAWLAFADFSHQAFARGADFVGVDFPAGVSFAGAHFMADAWFSGARFSGGADFRGTRFGGDSFFEQCWFKAQTHFDKSAFAGSARFSAVITLAGFSACQAQFARDLWMRASQLFGPLDFARSRIMGEAGFGSCNFHDVDFTEVEFCDNAGFEDSVFAGDAVFEHACFGRNARFERAQFAVQPRFKAARFFHACHFDDAMIPLTRSPAAACRDEIERRLQI